jgi:hypothetical protein
VPVTYRLRTLAYELELEQGLFTDAQLYLCNDCNKLHLDEDVTPTVTAATSPAGGGPGDLGKHLWPLLADVNASPTITMAQAVLNWATTHLGTCAVWDQRDDDDDEDGNDAFLNTLDEVGESDWREFATVYKPSTHVVSPGVQVSNIVAQAQ